MYVIQNIIPLPLPPSYQGRRGDFLYLILMYLMAGVIIGWFLFSPKKSVMIK